MHYTEDDLILYYYGEHRRRVVVEQHLEACAACRAVYEDITASLALVGELETPERGGQYGLEVWQRIRHRLPEQEPSWWAIWTQPSRLAFAGAGIVLVLAAFVVGRSWPGPEPAAPPAATAVEALPDAGERVRLAAVGDHLERSERLLLDFVNASGTADAPADVSAQQSWAADLITANRLFRDASTEAGDETVAVLLDELERNLLELVHGPATLTAAEIEQLRLRLDAAALLFRVRVLSEEMRERELAPITPRKTI
jgi:hypothetical protein